jgi:hypothetical protein
MISSMKVSAGVARSIPNLALLRNGWDFAIDEYNEE